MNWLVRWGVVPVAAGLAACAHIPDAARGTVITPDTTSNPKVIRIESFECERNIPAPPTDESHLPLQERINREMRRFAEIKLREAGYCTHGFAGPTFVTGNESDRCYRSFRVECLPPPRP